MSVFWKKVPNWSIPCTGTKKDPLELSLISLSSVLPDSLEEGWRQLKNSFHVIIINIHYACAIAWINAEMEMLSAVNPTSWKFPLSKFMEFFTTSAVNWVLTSMIAMMKTEPEVWKYLQIPNSFKMIREGLLKPLAASVVQINSIALSWTGHGLCVEIHWVETCWRTPNLKDTERAEQLGPTLKWDNKI